MVPFYHPTTVFVVDDEPLFLKSFEYGYGDQFLCHMERSPDQALQTLTCSSRNMHRHIVRQHSASEPADSIEPLGHRTLKLRTSELAQMLQDDRRFETISVIIVDYVMPSMNGIDFCRKIKELPAKKVLLTGRAGDGTAVEAFNEGLIDHFLVKHDSEISTKLPELIRRLQLQFFEDLGQRSNLCGNEQTNSFLAQGAVVDEVMELLRKHHACEYYVCGNPSGIVFANEYGKVGFISIVDDDERRAQREIAEAANAPKDLIGELARDEVIAVFPASSGYYDQSVCSTWQRYVHPAKLIKTPSGRWGLSVLFGENGASLLPRRVHSLSQYKILNQ